MSEHIVARPSAIPFGLQNLGSTCYVNTSMQYLYTAFLRNPPRDIGKPLGKNMVQFCTDQNIIALVNYLQRIFPEKRITYSSGDVNSLVDDICCVLNNEDPEYMDYFRIRSRGFCQCRSPNYEFKQDLFVLPLVRYKESASNTDLNDLIRQWQKTEDCCHYCPQSVQLSHKLPKCLLMLIEDTNFEPERYKTLQIESRNYELVSFTMHYGSMSGGHETCAALRNGEWHLFDDSRHCPFDAYKTRQHVRLVMYIEKEGETTVNIPPEDLTNKHEISHLPPNEKEHSRWTKAVKWTAVTLSSASLAAFGMDPVTFLNEACTIIRRSWNYYWIPIQRMIISYLMMLKLCIGSSFICTKMTSFCNYVQRIYYYQRRKPFPQNRSERGRDSVIIEKPGLSDPTKEE